ncbi:DUF4389 domain-containing protein [Streptomyces sp. NPDC017993]|uniref:DUF4389 domain-containing protein n=1 Tax=Streptomyces sp. NPDC017993 TaxID=3365027 RepID=UPI0037B442F6
MTDGRWGPDRAAGSSTEWLSALDIPEPGPQSRLTVLLRLLLLIPHFVVLFFLYIAAFFTVIAGWFAALVLGRLPEPIFRFLGGYLGYHTRVGASAMLLVDRYPPFTLTPPADYPVQIALRPEPLNRLAVFFRLILLIPVAIVESLVTWGWWALCLIWWLITLILGRMPRPLFEASAATLRYQMRYYAYGMLLTSAYPKRLFGDRATVTEEPARSAVTGEPARSATRPLLVSDLGKALIVLFLVAGVACGSTSSFASHTEDDEFKYTGNGAHRQPLSYPGCPVGTRAGAWCAHR